MPKRLLLIFIAITALAFVAGCGSDSEDETTSAAGGGDTTSASTPEPAPPPEKPAKQGTPPVGDGNGGVELTEVGSFTEPVWLTQAPGGEELYVVEQSGAVRVIGADGQTLPEPFLDVSDEIVSGGEQGLLSLAFAPDYEQSGLFYVDYTDTDGDTRIVEYQRSGDDPLVADPASKRVVLAQDQPYENHNGGLVLFGPDDNLYIGFGDGGSGGDPERNAQNLQTFLGKILRIDPRESGGKAYSVPDGQGNGMRAIDPRAKPEIFAYGLRNPWRFSFDRGPADSSLWVGDVGQSAQEEIDVAHPTVEGQNFGWSAFEGTERFNEDQQVDPKASNTVIPVLTYGREDGCSVTGGYVVRDPRLTSLYGRYLYGDFCEGKLRSFVASSSAADKNGRDDRDLGAEVSSLSSFAEDNAGHIYAISLEGPVYRLDPAN